MGGMGGIAGRQVLTRMMRGQAQGNVERSKAGWPLNRGGGVGAVSGVLWALVCEVIAISWFQILTVGISIACAAMSKLFAAALAGKMLPGTEG